jgi:hypothetical protein
MYPIEQLVIGLAWRMDSHQVVEAGRDYVFDRHLHLQCRIWNYMSAWSEQLSTLTPKVLPLIPVDLGRSGLPRQSSEAPGEHRLPAPV